MANEIVSNFGQVFSMATLIAVPILAYEDVPSKIDIRKIRSRQLSPEEKEVEGGV